jgi:hypothetical protein
MSVMQNMDNLMKPYLPLKSRSFMTHFWSKKQSLLYFIKKLKDKNQAEQQQKQAFQEVSIFYGIKNTDQDEIGALKNKKVNISTEKLA